MSIWDRFKRSVQANLNAMISKSENPEKMLNQLIIEMNTQLLEAKKSVAAAITDERRMARELEFKARKSQEWEERAIFALRKSEEIPEEKEKYENMAREALKAKRDNDAYVEEQSKQHDIQYENVQKLKESLRELQSKIEEAQRKKNILLARARRAETQKKIQDQISGFSDNSSFHAFQELEKKVESMEYEVETSGEMSDVQSAIPGSLEDEFKKLERNQKDEGIESSLEDLKQRMKQIPNANSNTSSNTSGDEKLNSLMEELRKKKESE